MKYSLLIKNCGQILTVKGEKARRGKEMAKLGVVKNGFVAVQGREIVAVGEMKKLDKSSVGRDTKIIDAGGKVVMPGLVECHTHLIFGGNRAHEWSDKIAGKSYLDILKAGGGILYTVKKTREASEKQLFESASKHLQKFIYYGVTTLEVKSGYGLDLKTELKILKVADMLAAEYPVKIVKTFLGAHVVPPEFKKSKDYLKFLLEQVLPKVSADFVDIFCEKKAFSVRESRAFLKAVKEMGFKFKIHAEQLSRQGGSRMAAELGATSFDHCDHLKLRDFSKLAKSGAVAVLLPLVPWYTREEKYANGRGMIDAGIPVAVSTDFNPGSCPSKNIFLAMTMACLKMGLTPEEAITGVTLNAAAALDRAKEIGSIEAGKRADIVILEVEDYKEIPYWAGENMISTTVIGGVANDPRG